MASKLIVGNWKLNPSGLNDAVALASGISMGIDSADFEHMVLLPPYIFLEELVKRFKQIQWGAQDVFWEQKGAYTGEVSLPMLKDIGVNWVLVGHSERRRYFHETDETVNKKTRAALEQGFNVIVAVGELSRDDDITEVEKSLKASISNVQHPMLDRLLVAYEPVWAISSNPGAVADDPARSNQIIGYLKRTLFNMFGPESEKIKFLYGGSVNAANAAGFLAQPNISGALVGGASLNAKEFISIIKSSN